MKFHSLPLEDSYLIELEPRVDERGFFARQFCERELAEIGWKHTIAQINQSHNLEAGTLRGLHMQLAPHAEVKIVQCVRGRLWDVIVDMREDSPTFRKWFGIELAPESHQLLYIPEGFAHGFITLEPNTELLYFVSAAYAPQYERGLLWSDPDLEIQWPIQPCSISEKDRTNTTLKQWLRDGNSARRLP